MVWEILFLTAMQGCDGELTVQTDDTAASGAEVELG